MEKSNQFIKVITVIIFASLMTAFVIFKSGCISTNKADKGEEINAIDLSELDKEYLDTLRIADTEYYALTKQMISSSKVMLAITPDDIVGFLHKDSVPKDFVSWTEVDSVTFNEWKKQQESESEEEMKMIAPSSKSAPVFEESKKKKKVIIPSSKSAPIFEDDEE